MKIMNESGAEQLIATAGRCSEDIFLRSISHLG